MTEVNPLTESEADEVQRWKFEGELIIDRETGLRFYVLSDAVAKWVCEGLNQYEAHALAARARLAECERETNRLRNRALRYYHADGTFEVMDSPESVVERRKADAVRIDALRSEVDAARAAMDALGNRRVGGKVAPYIVNYRAIRRENEAREAAQKGEGNA